MTLTHTLAVASSCASFPEALLMRGSRDTLRDHPGEQYQGITVPQVEAMARAPSRLPKEQAPCAILSTYRNHDGRVHEVQAQHGEFIALPGDVDTGNPSIHELDAALVAVYGDVRRLIYSTASATQEHRKWRFLIPLAEPLAGALYHEVQVAAFELLAERGITCDRAMARPGQPAYLPNVPPAKRASDGAPLFYDSCVRGTEMFSVSGSVIEARVIERQRAAEAAREAAQAEARQRAKKRQASARGVLPTPIDAFNDGTRIEDLLVQYGYERHGRDWRSKHQTSASYGTRIMDGGKAWVSLSESDAEAGLGQRGLRGGCYGDAFDLFLHYEHGGNMKAALRAAYESIRLHDGRTLAEASKAVYAVEQEALRQAAREEAREIGEGSDELGPVPEVLDLDAMLSRLVFLSDGSRVVDREHPRRPMTLADARNLYAGSRTETEASDGRRKSSRTLDLWMTHPQRRTTHGTTFNAAAGEFCSDPEGHPCVNTWRPFQRGGEKADPGILIGQIVWLFGDRADDFLDWLAHIEQHPGVLPHTAWLHIAPRTGLGRNTLANALARLWAGHVALCVDLPGILGGGFNGVLSRKLLAVVDEIREGGADRWRHAEAMKSLITAENRLINPKYGRQSVEHNASRWLMFSNHRSALPLDDSDRRIEVVICDHEPRDTRYYDNLVAATKNAAVINGFAQYLRERDLSRFNPGRHSRRDEAREQVVETSRDPVTTAVMEFVQGEGSAGYDLFTASALYRAAELEPQGRAMQQMKRACEDAGLAWLGRVRLGGVNAQVVYVRAERRAHWNAIQRGRGIQPSEVVQ